eukprot:m.464983 g.464983  ORF g.464983 m.464983 type:complete len:58 (-) comp23905_c0_seq1:109-282(-)
MLLQKHRILSTWNPLQSTGQESTPTSLPTYTVIRWVPNKEANPRRYALFNHKGWPGF